MSRGRIQAPLHRRPDQSEKPLDSPLTIAVDIHEAVMALPPDERRDREKVNAAVRRAISDAPR